MILLLDTHAFLWFVWSDPKLSVYAKTLIEDANNEIYFSAASAWEIAIKVSSGKLSLGQELGEFLQTQIDENQMTLLPVSISHSAEVATMSFHHKDPFDRLLVAQSLVEEVPIISNEVIFDKYGVKRLW